MRSQTYAVFTVKKTMHPRDDAPPLAKMEACPSVAVVGRNLTKHFCDLEAVRSISFDVPARLSSLTFALEPVTTACVRGGISPTDLDHGIWQWQRRR